MAAITDRFQQMLMTHKGSGETPSDESIQTAIKVGTGKLSADVAYGEEGLSPPTVGPISIDPVDYLSPGALGKGLAALVGGIKGFHGTGAAISKFKNEFAQDGVQGWGHYLGKKEGIAKEYAGDTGNVYSVSSEVDTKQLLKLDKLPEDQPEEVIKILQKHKLMPEGYSKFISVDTSVYSRLVDKLGSQKAASEYLHSIGIKGAVYRHTDVRDPKNKGTAYLMYSDKDLQIDNPTLHRGVEKGTMDLAGQSPREGGIHLTVDEAVAQDFAKGYKEGEVGSFKHNLKKPFMADEGDAGVQWFPNVYVDNLLRGKSKLSKEGKAELQALKQEWDEGFKNLPDEGLAEAKDKLSGDINKKINEVVKKEGYDHVQYTNLTEGKEGAMSYLVFDMKDLERVK